MVACDRGTSPQPLSTARKGAGGEVPRVADDRGPVAECAGSIATAGAPRAGACHRVARAATPPVATDLNCPYCRFTAASLLAASASTTNSKRPFFGRISCAG